MITYVQTLFRMKNSSAVSILLLSGSLAGSAVFAQSPATLAACGMNEGTGTTITDASGNGLSGTLQGATWTSAGKYGNALSFNGSSSYVDLGNPTTLKLTGSMTLSAWMYATGTPSNDGQIIAKSGDSDGWQLKTTPDTGPRTFGIKTHDVLAIYLKDADAPSLPYVVTTTDGSVFQSKTIKMSKDSVSIEDPNLGPLELPRDELAQLKVNAPAPRVP